METIVAAAALFPFRHDEGLGGQLVQICLGVALWSVFIYVGLKLFLILYETGKGDKERLELERENDDLPSGVGWYRIVFCLRLAITIAFMIEGNRFGGGWPSLVLYAMSVAAWFGLAPVRQWMRHSR